MDDQELERSTGEPPAPVEAWFAVRKAGCEPVVASLGVAATLRSGEVSPWQSEELAGFCAVGPAPGQRGLRLDSLAMRASEVTGAAAIAFYATRGSWSYAIFEAGRPVLTLESHVGRPALDGDPSRARELVGADPQVVRESLEVCRDMARFEAFVAHLGLSGFRQRVAAAMVQAGPGGSSPGLAGVQVAGASDPSATLAKIPPGTWAALPPLGVVLVKAVEVRERDGVAEPTYVIVSGPSTLELPVIRAETMGMRPLATRKRALEVMSFVEDGVSSPGRSYDAARVQGWLDAMRSGDLMGIARVFATLCALRGSRPLYQVEAALAASSQDWLTAELAAARQLPPDDVEAALKRACR